MIKKLFCCLCHQANDKRIKELETEVAQLKQINIELLEPLTEIYLWTHHKNTPWAKKTAKAISIATRKS